MSEDKIVIRGLLRHYWKRGFSAKAAAEIICEFEGEGVIHRNTAAIWYKRFMDGDTTLSDKSRSGRPLVVNKQVLRTALEEQPHSSTRDLSAILGVSHTTISRNLKSLGFANKAPRQCPYDLTDCQAEQRVKVCKELLQNPLDIRFFKRIVTCDEKWIFLHNPDKRKQWVPKNEEPLTVVRHDRFGHKVMLSVWWNFEGIIHFELIPKGKAVDAQLYVAQIKRVHEILQSRYPAIINRKRVLYQHDNAPSHRAKLTQQAFKDIDCIEVLPHPAYSPDLAPSDYGLFRSMAHFLQGRRFKDFNDVEEGLREFFASKTKDWYQHQIELLAERWVTVINNGGLYFKE